MRPLIGHPIVQNIAVLGSGTAIAQVVNIAATPLLAALYGPDSFGLMAIFMGIVLVAGTMASLTYDSAIVLARKRDEAEALLALCWLIIMAVTVFVFFAMALYYMVAWDSDSTLHVGLLFVAPLGVFFLGVFNVATNWMTRIEAFGEISAGNLIRSVGAVAAQLGLGVLGGGGLSLILGRVFGQVAAAVYLIRRGSLLSKWHWQVPASSLRDVAKRYYRFPVFKAPQSAIVLIAEQAPALALGFFFGPTFAGLYWLADRILSLPCIILSESTARVFYAEATKRHQDGQVLIPILLKTIFGLAAAAVVPSIILVFYAPTLLSLLGSQWEPAGVYVQWMTLWAFCRFSCAPVMATYMVLDDQKSLLKIDSLAMIIRFPSIIAIGIFGSPMMLVAMICVFESIKIIATIVHILFRLSSGQEHSRASL